MCSLGVHAGRGGGVCIYIVLCMNTKAIEGHQVPVLAYTFETEPLIEPGARVTAS